MTSSPGILDMDTDGVVFAMRFSKIFTRILIILTMNQRINIVKLLSAFKCLFADVPTQTNVLQHDIKVIGARPIKQHAYRVNTVKDLLCVKR